ncbi:sigma-70 family RNA polymerase sigma factor [Bacillus sp. PS06]|uniref:sigma-70 family RNA polymerase sigma factor n=1 Tax=Bacillus sp. PS06 TaxID=2764176 RepID=UPI001782323F|nr:sigma-70 family RNA polymerase sigma factor [Bacillus sp. PS06]MBD8071158.1 sigma-70 family RNA polymerase sigma factor [Bacillus sp. PS06]
MDTAFEKLVDDFNPMIYGIMKKLHLYRDQEAFYQVGLIALWEAHTRFDPEKGTFSTFAYATIRGRLLEYLTKEKQFYDNHQGLPSEDAIGLVDTTSFLLLENEMIDQYCEGLSDKQRKWVQKRIIEDKRIIDIANEEGVTPDAVKSWGKAALKKLRGRIGVG